MIQIVKEISMYQLVEEGSPTQTAVQRLLIHIVGTCLMDQVVQPD